ncbi:MAG TPA: hypothetical protein VFD52_05375 [Clostridia bacterium]|nr:hypothetical protein [Clostridia bacterium]
MKKTFVVILSILMALLLSSCATEDIMDAYIFSERFNKQSKDFEINPESITHIDENGEKKYYISIQSDDSDDEFLITLFANKEGYVDTCSVTMSNENAENKEAPSQSTLLHFKWLLISTCAAYTKDSVKNVEEVLAEFAIENDNPKEYAGSKYKETRQFRYAYTANILGASLIIENVRLVPEIRNELTLKNS